VVTRLPWPRMDAPIIQAPMAGVSSPRMAADVTDMGGLGSVAVGAMTVPQARATIREFRQCCDGPVNVNLFTHRPARADPLKQAAWLRRLEPLFDRMGGHGPAGLREIYPSFRGDAEMLSMLVAERPAVVSFHFGLPGPEQVEALHGAGIFLLATATNLREAALIEAAGIDGVVAQGFEAGGHRGMFDPDADDECLGTHALVRQLVRGTALPVIAAGGLMDGTDIAAMLALGACAAQLGTAFIATDESLADSGYRSQLLSRDAAETVMARVISGRPARGIANAFTRWGRSVATSDIPDYPIAYDAGKALHRAAMAAGSCDYAAHWAGQGAPRVRALPTQALMRALIEELEAARGPEETDGHGSH
jgi:nitronate monooxygenase